jgi:outer membrane receptor protein involved in Fe transport
MLAVPVPAHAQAPDAPAAPAADAAAAPDAASDPGAITVTARHRAESLQTVPIAIDAFSAETLQRDGVQNVQDLARLSPSLNFTKGFSPQDNEPSIRGLPGGSGRPPVAVLVDGIDTSTQSIATSGGGNLVDVRLVDLERVEVVKGPQSALYGRSAFGGAINYISKEPDHTFGGYLSSDVGLYGRGEVRGAVNLPVSDTLAVRFNGIYSTYNGYYTNTVTGNKLGGYEVYGGAFAAKWTPSPNVKILARVSYSNDHEDESATKYYGEEDGLATNVALPASLVGTAVGGGQLPATLLEYRPGNVNNENVPIALSADPADPTGHTDYPGAHTYNVLSSLRAEWNTGFATLMSLTGYTHSTGGTQADVDYFGRPLTQVSLPYPGGLGEYSGSAAGNGFWQFDIHTLTKQFSEELRLSHLDSGRFRWAVGGLYWHEKVTQLDGRLLEFFGFGPGVSSSLNIAEQNGGRSPVLGVDGRTTDHYSGYGLAEFDILPNLTASAEGRYAYERYNYLFGDSVTEGSGNPATGPVPFVLTGSPYSTSSTTKYFTPRGILTWKPLPNLMTYISAARGVKPGGISAVGAADPSLGRYLPEHLSNYEFGAKGSFLDHRLTVDLAVFHMDYTNMQTTTLIAVPTTVSAQGSLSVTGNAGKATIDGQEIDIALRATPELTLSANFTHLTPVFKNYILDSTYAFDVIRGGNCTVVTVSGSTTCAVSFAGKDINEAPRYAGLATADYLKPIAGDLKGFGEVSAQYHGKSYVDAGDYWTLKAYTIVNVKLGLQAPKWSVTAYVNNLFDNRTIQNAMWLLDVPSGSFGNLDTVAYLPDPRTFGVRMQYKF